MEIDNYNNIKDKLDISQHIKLPFRIKEHKKEIASLTTPNFFPKNKCKHETQTLNQKTKSFNDKLRMKIKKIMQKKKVGYEKKIYTSLYGQIHKSVSSIIRQINSAKKLLSPKNKRKNNNKNYFSPLFNNTRKYKLYDKNIENNCKFLIKKPLLFLTNFPRKQPNYFPTEMNSQKTIKKITLNNFDTNYNIKKNSEIIEYNNKDNDKKNIRTISCDLSKSCKKSRALSDLPEYSNKKNNYIEDTITNINNNSNINQRYKCLYVKYEHNWYKKHKFIRFRLDKAIIENSTLQPKLIDDELALLFESLKIIQSDYLMKNNLFSLYCKQGIYTQKSMNLLLEESIGLVREISYLLLDGYNKIIDKFITNPLPRITKKILKIAKDEKKEFLPNINLLSKSYTFLKVCYDAYKVLLSHGENFFIKYRNFNVLYQYIERARFNISKICIYLNNMYSDNTKEDKKIINDYINKIKKSDRRRKLQCETQRNKIHTQINLYKNIENKQNNEKKFNKIKTKLDCHMKFSFSQSGINPFNYTGPKKLKLPEDYLTIMRINKALGPKTSRENKHIVRVHQFDINSSLVNQLLNYASKEFKKKVMSERIRQKFSDN